jgi:hypothetical protein
LTCTVVLASLALSYVLVITYAYQADQVMAFLQRSGGQSRMRIYRALEKRAEDPNFHFLTDSGLLDLYRRERADFGDPWLFRLMVETGRIDPIKMKERIENKYYEVVITKSDLMSDGYAQFNAGLPTVLYERVRAHYEPVGQLEDLFYYAPRGAERRQGVPGLAP